MKKYHINIIAILTALLIFPLISRAQVITTFPAFPTAADSVLITFDATQGDGGLEGFDGDVYAHTGVITSESGGQWAYVVAGWTENIPKAKLTRIDNDLYTLNIGPSIRDYYGVPAGEEILQMAFVFRSADTEVTGRDVGGDDIFTDVYKAELNVLFIKPALPEVIVQPEDTIAVEVAANFADSIYLYLEDELIAETTENVLLDSIIAESSGKYWVKSVAVNDTGMVADSFYYYVRGDVTIEERPEGIRSGINYTSDTSVILSLTAPGKEFVFVIGDFNNWQLEEEYFMKMTPDGEEFWLEINGLVPQQEYIFQYFVEGEIKIADPYANQISDPWNDQYISEDTYPGLIEYPDGKTTGIASVLQTAQEEFDWTVENFEPVGIQELVIYEILVRDFTEDHTYAAMTERLDYLEELGITAVELMPVNEFEGNVSWGYNPSFYFAADKYYGPEDELKKFIDECHERGMAVIIDMVLNHSYDQSPFVQLYFEGDKPAENNPWYNREHNFENPDAQWGNDFNHESPYTKQLVDSINAFWMEEFKVDGFRFDFTKGFGNNIKDANTDPWGSNYDADRIALLKRMADEIWVRNPDALIILEHLAENAEDEELADYGMLMWGNMNYNYAEATMGYIGTSNFSGISYQQRGWENPHLIGYMESHDEERVMYKNITYGNSSGDYNTTDTATSIARVALAANFFIPVPGPKMIWQFGELGYDYSIDFNGRLGPKPVRWDYYDDYRRRYLYNTFAELNHLKQTYEVFKTDDFDLSVGGARKQIQLNHPEMNVSIIGNFGLESGTIEADFQHTGMWYEFYTGDSMDVQSLPAEIELEAGEYRLYTDVKLPAVETGLGLDENPGESSCIITSVYPNPFSSGLNISVDLPEQANIRVELYDHTGRLSQELFSGRIEGRKDISTNPEVPSGVYFIRLISEQHQEVRKIIKLDW